MTNLYIRAGTDPQPLPFEAYDADGRLWTDLANNEEGREATGWDSLAPEKPAFDPVTHRLEWDGTAEIWVVIALPPPEPPPPPPSITLTVGEFVGRFIIPDEDDVFADLDDAMMANASRLVRRNWANAAYRFTENDGFWTILAGNLDGLVSADRKAELLARSDPNAAMMATAEAA